MAVTARKLTMADFERIPADGFRHEIIEGEEYMTPVPTPEHQSVIVNLTMILSSHAARGNLGRVLVAPTDVVLSEHDVVEPDLLFVARERLGIIGPRNLQGAPDLVVEVSSPSTAAIDRGPKRALYERAGVSEYWIVDLLARTVEVHELGSPRRVRIYKEGQSFESAILPGLPVRVDGVFAA